MNKHLIFYWYINPGGWCDIYDLHINNCSFYKDVFDLVTFVVSTDDNTNQELIDLTREKLLNVFPEAELVYFKNDKELRESAYFHDEVIEKLNTFNKDEALFFAHNKGVYTNYTSKEDLFDWINCMYVCNLGDITKIDDLLQKEETITIGSCCVTNYNPPHFKYCKYKWHYQGSFFWFVPSRLLYYLKESKETPPPTTRYYTEIMFGSIFPFESEHCVKLYGTKGVHDNYKNYMSKNFTENILLAYGKLLLKLK